MNTAIRSLLFVFILSFRAQLFAQHAYSGIIADSRSGDPLAFVNLTGEDNRTGTHSDIDGKFSIAFQDKPAYIRFVYIGYEELFIRTDDIRDPKNMKVLLKRKPVSLGEVIVKAGVNPAHRIIRRAIANKELNDPENLPGFNYESYNKLIVTADSIDKSLPQPSDTSALNSKKFFERNHLFLSESVTLRNYRYKGLNKEKVIASRVSGLKTPIFTLLATQFQSFSFYKDHITVSDKNYLNPLSQGSISKYIFVLEDTSYTGSDTVYQISFEPRPGKNIDGLKGVLYINTSTYAVQNVLAHPAEAEGGTSVHIQQQYARVGEHWFPVQLNTDIIFKNLGIDGRPLKGNARSYLSSIDIGSPIEKKEFSAVELEVDDEASKRDESFWARYRKDTLTIKEKSTYHVIDSIGKEAKLEEKLKTFTSFMSGRYPLGKIDIDINKLVDYNEHEGYRLGTGLYTNSRLSKHFITGGYAAYGINDEEFKYGGSLSIKLKRLNQGVLHFSYQNDVTETGNQGSFLRSQSLLAEDYRRFSVNMMDRHEMGSASLHLRTFKYLSLQAGVNRHRREPLFIANERQVYDFSEVQLMMRYAYREKFMQILGDQVSLGTDKPVIWFTVTKGIKGFADGDYDFLRLESMASYSFMIRNAGKLNFHLKAGIRKGAKILPLQYHLRGSNDNWELYDPESFQTMGINEFFSDRFANVFIRHDFGKLLMKNKYFSPSLSLVHALALFRQESVRFKPYTEAGILVKDVVKVSFLGIGAGAFYRYGEFHLPEEKRNFTFKIATSISI